MITYTLTFPNGKSMTVKSENRGEARACVQTYLALTRMGFDINALAEEA